MSAQYKQDVATQYLVSDHEEYKIRNSVLVDGGDRFGVSTVVFDKYEELIWMGNQGGHVTSYYGPHMKKYTSFQAHDTEEVQDIITHEEALYILTKSTLRKQLRRGLPKHTFKSDHMVDMNCLYQMSSTRLLMGGNQNKMLELDLSAMKETVIWIKEESCAVVRSGGRSLMACGSAGGRVTLRDARTYRAAQAFRAHTACLCDLDMQGDLLITCGFADSSSGAVPESFVRAWDVRYLRGSRGAWTVSLASAPLLLHFLPAESGRAVALAGDGRVALLSVNTGGDEAPSVFQVDTQNSQCTVMDVSTSSQALVFGDQSGHLNLFTPKHDHELVFNSSSRETEFANKRSLPFVAFTDTSFQYSSVRLPPLTTGNRWCNEMPQSFYRTGHRTRKPIDPAAQKTRNGGIGCAPNAATSRRNQVLYLRAFIRLLACLEILKMTGQLTPR